MDSLILDAYYSNIVGHRTPHFHDCHQLLYISQGRVKVTVQGKEYLAAPGSMVLISRFEEHAIHAVDDTYCRYALHINPDFHALAIPQYEPLLSVLVNRPENFRHVIVLSCCNNPEPLLQQILRENAAIQPMRESMLNLLTMQLLLILCREHPHLLTEETEQLHLVQKIQANFETNYAQKCTLADLSRQYHLSPSYLSHLFKRVTGSSVMGYLFDCRLAAAKRYLAETDAEIGQIVELCGFSDNSNFSRMFKTTVGLSPSQFRNQFHIKNRETHKCPGH